MSPGLAVRLFGHCEVRSFCFYRDDHFIVHFELREFIGGAKCFFDKSLSMDRPMILRNG